MATAQRVSSQQLANGLGWFSIGLGLAELISPKAVSALIGVNGGGGTKKILRFYGARELAAGVGILSGTNPPAWLWARVAGDLLDLSSLGKALVSDDNERGKVIAATAAVLGVTVADVRCAMQLTTAKNGKQNHEDAPTITSSIIIARGPDEIYGFWRDFGRLPEIFDRLQSVQVRDERHSHWKLALPMGQTIEWDAEITDTQPSSRIAWRSLSSSAPHSGEVRFEPATGQRGTKVTVKIRPGGLSAGISKLVGFVPERNVKIALQNLKQLLEVGEIVKSDSSIHRGMHAAQPPEHFPATPERMRAAATV
jgi:uncharacterized membrane protein